MLDKQDLLSVHERISSVISTTTSLVKNILVLNPQHAYQENNFSTQYYCHF